MRSSWPPHYYRPDPLELVSGHITGVLDRPDPVYAAGRDLPHGMSPRAVLEEVVLAALTRPPCVVEFSGGRDSSVLLAVGAHVARREGLPMPVPITFRYQNEPHTDESSWQEMVIAHVGIADWERVDVGNRHDMVGDLATQFLRGHGVVYPPTLYNKTLPFTLGRGGSHMSGEGGDEVFGFRRGAVLRKLRSEPRLLLHRRNIRDLGLYLGPVQVRAVLLRKSISAVIEDCLTYLRPGVECQVLDNLVKEHAAEPFDVTSSLGWHLRRKVVANLQEAITAFAAESDVFHLDPFLEPRFVASYARVVKPLGLCSRTQAMRSLFADLLPDALLTRTSKAIFNRGYLTDVGRAFAANWHGGGVDTRLVDTEKLRSRWLSEWPPHQSFLLLQAAWLHENQPQPDLQ